MAASSIPEQHARQILRDLEAIAAQRDALDESQSYLDEARVLAEFLAYCASSLTNNRGPDERQIADELQQARDLFVRACFDALAARLACTHDWHQLGIHPTGDSEPQSELYRQIWALAERLLTAGAIDNFFYMNKAPGMRLRFQASAAGRAGDLRAVLDAEVARWRLDRLIDGIDLGVYEPETRLFGGSRSMPYVHALFTVDSLIWLDYHAGRPSEGEEITPPWLMSLALLRTVFAGLDIVGWEDLGVWDHVVAKAGRRLGPAKLDLPMYSAVANEIRDVWSHRDQIVERLDSAARAIVARHDAALLAAAAQWRSGYFSQPAACIGPRAAAAFFVIFHWNRAGLHPTEQALLAESLAEREI